MSLPALAGVPSSLAPAEAASLVKCEASIERGLATFVEVGQALLAIRDERLYRETHPTFEDYCRERWDFSRPRAYPVDDLLSKARAAVPITDDDMKEAA